MSRATIEKLMDDNKRLREALAKSDEARSALAASHIQYAQDTSATIGQLIEIIQEQYRQLLEIRVPGINPPMGSPPYPGYNEKNLK